MTTSETPARPTQTPMVLVDLRIPFLRLVLFFVKAALAVIPAAIILAAIAFAVCAVLVILFGIQGEFMMRRWMM